MAIYKNITSTGTIVLRDKSNYSTNTSLNRRGISVTKINKISVANTGSVDATVYLHLKAVEVTRTVNQANNTTDKIIFDEDIIVSEADQIKVGDSVIDSDSTVHGTVSSINPSAKSIVISASVAITDNEVLTFRDAQDRLGIVKTVIPSNTTLVLDDSFSFNIYRYSLLVNTTVSSGTPNLTITIE